MAVPGFGAVIVMLVLRILAMRMGFERFAGTHIQLLDAGRFRERDDADILGQRLDYPRREGLDGLGNAEDDVGCIQRLGVGRLQGIGVRRGGARYEQRRRAHALHDLRNQSMYGLDRDRDVEIGGYRALRWR